MGKNPPVNAGDTGDAGLTPGLGRSPGGGNGNPLQDPHLKKSHEQRSLVGYSSWGCKESDMTEHTCTGIPLFFFFFHSTMHIQGITLQML